MEYSLSFDSKIFRFQEANRLPSVEIIVQNLSDILEMKVNVRSVSSKTISNTVHFIVECDGDLDALLKAIDGKIMHIKEFGIEDIELWCYYAYEGQCNLEFTPMQLLKMGKNGLPLLISCWEKEID